ncbi:hypothetical protein [Kribbella deserti]|uniref:Uncharacterized protein n=1 Tax=Kribbella deserti TaxID=1926257 RepID=A0ABV6QJ09_9ACTN
MVELLSMGGGVRDRKRAGEFRNGRAPEIVEFIRQFGQKEAVGGKRLHLGSINLWKAVISVNGV